MKFIYLLARSYNDIDCRLPLLLEFADDAAYRVTIIGIPMNTGMQNPRLHELIGFLEEKGILVKTIFNFIDSTLMLRFLSTIYQYVAECFLIEKISSRFHHKIKALLFRNILRMFSRSIDLDSKCMNQFESSIVFVDEVIFHEGRSLFVDTLLKSWSENRNFQIYAFLTGQDPYIDPPYSIQRQPADDNWAELKRFDTRIVDIPFIVPSPNDSRNVRSQFNGANIVISGNTRFDKSWVLQRKALTRVGVSRITKRTKSQESCRKIVFMLSKLEYGVEVNNLIETINRCACLNNTTVIIKPHTRGMNASNLVSKLKSSVIDGSGYSSSDLVEWADYLLFNGSSIAFHALVLKKQVIYLKYCQKYKSIFDNCESLLVAACIDDVHGHLFYSRRLNINEEKLKRFLSFHVYNGSDDGLICKRLKAWVETSENEMTNSKLG
ncbi:MAG: hypothetical protein P8N92_01340 [Burkholderiales bacterium]|nr:hypothetical protein [Burkholderiales bacterium]